jgi:hypothetical protein
MRQRPRVATLFARAFTGLITVWCLGCSGYESLLNSLLAHSTGMTCGSEMTGDMAIGQTDDGASAAPTASVAESAPRDGFDCGCGSCNAASPQIWNVQVATAAPPTVVSMIVIAPLSVTRSPIAPPPQSRI